MLSSGGMRRLRRRLFAETWCEIACGSWSTQLKVDLVGVDARALAQCLNTLDLTAPVLPHAFQKSAALLGQMLNEGYGCKANPERGREWIEKARRRGYRMHRVYCEI